MDATPLFPGMECHPLYIMASRDGRLYLNPLTRSEAPVKYYFIDFGLATRFEKGRAGLVTGADGRDRDVPELSDHVPYDPFKVDVFILGNCYRTEFLNVRNSLPQGGLSFTSQDRNSTASASLVLFSMQ
jgi:hypothetical protein